LYSMKNHLLCRIEVGSDIQGARGRRRLAASKKMQSMVTEFA
jgi:hypothetical protein